MILLAGKNHWNKNRELDEVSFMCEGLKWGHFVSLHEGGDGDNIE